MPKAVELREQTAAKYKEANEYLKGLGKDDYNTLTPDEVERFQGIMTEAKTLDDQYAKSEGIEKDFERLTDRMAYYHEAATGRKTGFHPLQGYQPKSLGERFAESDSYKGLVKSGALGSANAKFVMDPVSDDRLRHQKAASDLIHSNPDGPADALVRPEYMPGIMPLPPRPLVIRELFSAGSIGSDTLIYAQQSARDSGAAAVAQASVVNGSGVSGGVKPQSSIAWEEQTATVKNVATWMAVTRQTLQDAGVVQSLIDNQGRLMLDLYIDDQLVNGDGNGPNISGLLNQDGLQELDLTGEDNLDGLRTAIRLVRTGLARVPADTVVLNPVDSEEFDLLKDDNGLYRGGNPIGNFDFGQSIWRLRRVESEVVEEGTALVGAFRTGATVLQRTPTQVFTTDSHADFFIRNLVVVLFEERLCMPVWWPSAFCVVTLADWTPGSGS
jgi:HK97 family phage major capsid protein